MSYSEFYTPTLGQMEGREPVRYTLKFNFYPLNQGQLVVAFALDYGVYLILYFLIGSFAVFTVFTFTTYHYLANRRRPRPEYLWMDYINIIYNNAFLATMFSMMPYALLLFVINIIMASSFWYALSEKELQLPIRLQP